MTKPALASIFPRESNSRSDFLGSRFGADYPSYQYIFVEFLMEHLSEVSRAFKGDMQQMLVLALIGQVHLRWARKCRDQSIAPSTVPPPEASISASRLADCTGIPRETVRRKLLLLQKQGWIDRAPDGRWRLVSVPDGEGTVARQALSELDKAAMKRVAGLVARLEELADEGRT
jgi:DNA-binding transcriptional ArsR family regulator